MKHIINIALISFSLSFSFISFSAEISISKKQFAKSRKKLDQQHQDEVNQQHQDEVNQQHQDEVNQQYQDEMNQQYQDGMSHLINYNHEESFKIFKKLADSGHALSQYETGGAYFNGHGGVAQDSNLAVKYLDKAAKQGITEAQSELARLYYGQHTAQKGFESTIFLLKEGKTNNSPLNIKKLIKITKYWYDLLEPEPEPEPNNLKKSSTSKLGKTAKKQALKQANSTEQIEDQNKDKDEVKVNLCEKNFES